MKIREKESEKATSRNGAGKATARERDRERERERERERAMTIVSSYVARASSASRDSLFARVIDGNRFNALSLQKEMTLF